MNRNILAGLALMTSLAACGGPSTETAATSRNQHVKVSAVNLAGRAYNCVPKGDVNIYSSNQELKGELRAKFLTPAARLARIRVWVASSDITNYGSTKITYTDEADTCVVWSEGLTLQEYSQRLGLNPVGMSPFYEVEKPKPVPATPALSPVAETPKG
jgi:hypothetical protein